MPPHTWIFAKAGAKVHTFSELPKLFREKFHISCKILPTLDQYQDIKYPTPYYIYKRKGKKVTMEAENRRRKEQVFIQYSEFFLGYFKKTS